MDQPGTRKDTRIARHATVAQSCPSKRRGGSCSARRKGGQLGGLARSRSSRLTLLQLRSRTSASCPLNSCRGLAPNTGITATGGFRSFSLASAPTEPAFLRPVVAAGVVGVAGGFCDMGVVGSAVDEPGGDDEGEVGESPEEAAAEAATSGN